MAIRKVKIQSRVTMSSIQPSNENSPSAPRSAGDTSWFSSFLLSRRRLSVLETWRGQIPQLPTSTWTAAFKTQILLARNAAESIACAWIPNACYALGNLFSGKWYTEQSREELLVANSMWASITYCGVVFIAFLPIMLSFRFTRAPDHPPTLWFCMVRLARATIFYFLVVTLSIFVSSSLTAYLAYIEPRSIKFKLDCYAVNFSLAGYFTGITRAVKRIYYEETIQGRDKFRQRQQKPRRSKLIPAKVLNIMNLQKPDPKKYRPPSYWLAYIKNLPLASVPLLASAFVHILSQQRIVNSGNVALTAFAFAGIALKLFVQEITKHYVFKKRVRSVRIMCLLVGVPTVLIDTQMRIILLGTNSTNTAAMGVLGMALVEISVRAGKAVLVIWEIRRRRALIGRKIVHKQAFGQRFSNAIVPDPQKISITSEFGVWCRQMQAFHAAEVNADMYAEYISIGCSASILFFYGNHPLYSLLRKSGSFETEKNDMVAWRMGQLRMLSMQIGLEVVVDYLSMVLEMTIGIEFDHVKNLNSFLAAMFMITAVMNINISICIYLS